jgi:hypothetical protein
MPFFHWLLSYISFSFLPLSLSLSISLSPSLLHPIVSNHHKSRSGITAILSQFSCIPSLSPLSLSVSFSPFLLLSLSLSFLLLSLYQIYQFTINPSVQRQYHRNVPPFSRSTVYEACRCSKSRYFVCHWRQRCKNSANIYATFSRAMA